MRRCPLLIVASGKPRLVEKHLETGGRAGIRTLEEALKPLNRLAGGPIRPLWHPPRCWYCICVAGKKKGRSRGSPVGQRFYPNLVYCSPYDEAEREGFEPPELALNCFQDSRHQPLGHLSTALLRCCVRSIIRIRLRFVKPQPADFLWGRGRLPAAGVVDNHVGASRGTGRGGKEYLDQLVAVGSSEAEQGRAVSDHLPALAG